MEAEQQVRITSEPPTRSELDEPLLQQAAADTKGKDTMELEHVQAAQRIRINVPGVGDHEQVGTVERVRPGRCCHVR